MNLFINMDLCNLVLITGNSLDGVVRRPGTSAGFTSIRSFKNKSDMMQYMWKESNELDREKQEKEKEEREKMEEELLKDKILLALQSTKNSKEDLEIKKTLRISVAKEEEKMKRSMPKNIWEILKHSQDLEELRKISKIKKQVRNGEELCNLIKFILRAYVNPVEHIKQVAGKDIMDDFREEQWKLEEKK